VEFLITKQNGEKRTVLNIRVSSKNIEKNINPRLISDQRHGPTSNSAVGKCSETVNAQRHGQTTIKSLLHFS
jgi:hypothetical protein